MIIIIYRKTIDKEKKIYKYYDKEDKEVKDKKILDYINSLPAIPPAYENVEIFYDSLDKTPKILYQAFDAAGRKQQIYSKKWREKADKEKFKALIDFGKKIPMISMDINKHMKSPVNTKDKIVSIILKIIMLCGFRIGQLKYQELYNSTGLSTLMKKHIKFKKDKMEIEFIGKKGVVNSCSIDDKEIIKHIEELIKNKNPRDHIFIYKENNEEKLINALDVNNWLKKYNPEFTSKMIRTYNSNAEFIAMSKKVDPNKLTETQRKKMVNEFIKEISCLINNTPTICKKSYIDPNLVKMFIENPRKYKNEIIDNNYSEIVLYMKFLEKIHK